MKVYLKTIIFFFFSCFIVNAIAQDVNTVGLIQYKAPSYNGYTLFSPMASNKSYLVDNCGEKVKEWTFEGLPGLLAYLQEDGSIYRAERSPGSFGAGGSGGRVVHKTWDDELVWSFIYSDDNVRQHHDFQPLPNGNVLLLAWERKTKEEAVDAGRNASFTSSDGVWFEHIVELEPVGLDSANIVWEWHVFDHLIQGQDSTVANFGVVDQSPNRFNVNYKNFNTFSPNEPGVPDWMHMNSIQYNEVRDEIMLSSRDFGEVYIIDHSTTSEEAKTGAGGNSGKGGDILFRWGNNATYNKGDIDDQLLFAQHHASWIESNTSVEVGFSVFNNGLGSSGFEDSSLEFIKPTIEDDKYVLSSEGVYMIDEHKTIVDNDILNFSSPRLSSIQILKNNNILIGSGNHGRILEITPEGELVWEYINPINNSGAFTQGENPFANDIFRAMRYSTDSRVFEGRELLPQGILEVNPDYEQCFIIDTTLSTANVLLLDAVKLYPNPIVDFLSIDIVNQPESLYSIYDLRGIIHKKGKVISEKPIDLSDLNSGFYFVKIRIKDQVQLFKIIKE